MKKIKLNKSKTAPLFNFKQLLKPKQIVIVSILTIVLILACILNNYLLWENPEKSYSRYLEKYKVNMLVDDTVKSQENYYLVDEEATNALIDSIKAASLPVFSISLKKSFNIMDDIETTSQNLKVSEESYIKTLGIEYNNTDFTSYDYYMDNYDIIDSAVKEFANNLIKQGIFEEDELEEKVSVGGKLEFLSGFNEEDKKILTAKNCITTNNFLQEAEREFIDFKSENIILNSSDLILAILKKNISSNIFFDALETQKLQNKEVSGAHNISYEIKKGDVLLEQDTLVTEKQLKILSLITEHHTSYPLNQLLGIALYSIIVVLIFVQVIYINLKEGYHNFAYFMIILIGNIATFVVIYFLNKWVNVYKESFLGPTLPVLIMPMLISMASNNKKLGYIDSLLLSFLVITIPNASLLTLAYCLFSGCSVVLFEKFLTKRKSMFYQWLFAFSSNVVFAFVVLLFLGLNLGTTLPLIIFKIFINVFGTYIIISLLLPILEEFLNLPTALRLNELANGSNALLEKLESDAPGTFSHSKQVSELAYAAAKAIGANELLCKTGGLYHDIGKIEHAAYFTENKSEDGNEEKSLNNYSSTLAVTIIRSHVKLGVEKGREAGLPQEILDIIGNHHGNDIVSFFYQEDLKAFAAGSKEEPKKEDYTYLGKPPATKEEGIIMLCDCSEAASRSLGKPNFASFQRFIQDEVLNKKIENNQLINCPLTVKELDTICKIIVENLMVNKHMRIAYPKDTAVKATGVK